MVQVTGKSLSSLTSMSFPLSGGNLSQFYCIHTPKLLKPNNQPVNQPVEKTIYFSQLTAVHRASLSPTSSLDNILFTVDGSAVSLLPRQAGHPTLVSPHLVWRRCRRDPPVCLCSSGWDWVINILCAFQPNIFPELFCLACLTLLRAKAEAGSSGPTYHSRLLRPIAEPQMG